MAGNVMRRERERTHLCAPQTWWRRVAAARSALGWYRPSVPRTLDQDGRGRSLTQNSISIFHKV